jgi:hypothetical protein
LKGKIYPQLRVKISFLKKLGKNYSENRMNRQASEKRVILYNFFNGELLRIFSANASLLGINKTLLCSSNMFPKTLKLSKTLLFFLQAFFQKLPKCLLVDTIRKTQDYKYSIKPKISLSK